MVRAGTLVPIIDRTITLEGVPEGLRLIASAGIEGKVVVTI